MNYKIILLNTVVISWLTGCAAVGGFQASDKTLKQKTAVALKTKASKVRISKRRRSADINTLRINVKANGRKYRCYYTMDYKGEVSNVKCKKRKSKKRRKK